MQHSKTQISLLSRLVRKFLVWIYHRNGWKAVGEVPKERRFVLIAAPHTSNWDFLYFVGLTEDLGIMPHFMGKKSLFRWPVRKFMFDMGGVAVDRASKQNYVEQMIDEFEKRDEFMLTIAPEGTRGKVKAWKTGFYHIAMGAKVPIVIGMMDYSRKTGGLGPAIWPTGDYAADMAQIKKQYDGVIPRHPDRIVKDIIGDGIT
jgi:1-acyl-sn-glycerol-3-phosphate acyltransferase